MPSVVLGFAEIGSPQTKLYPNLKLKTAGNPFRKRLSITHNATVQK